MTLRKIQPKANPSKPDAQPTRHRCKQPDSKRPLRPPRQVIGRRHNRRNRGSAVAKETGRQAGGSASKPPSRCGRDGAHTRDATDRCWRQPATPRRRDAPRRWRHGSTLQIGPSGPNRKAARRSFCRPESSFAQENGGSLRTLIASQDSYDPKSAVVRQAEFARFTGSTSSSPSGDPAHFPMRSHLFCAIIRSQPPRPPFVRFSI